MEFFLLIIMATVSLAAALIFYHKYEEARNTLNAERSSNEHQVKHLRDTIERMTMLYGNQHRIYMSLYRLMLGEKVEKGHEEREPCGNLACDSCYPVQDRRH